MVLALIFALTWLSAAYVYNRRSAFLLGAFTLALLLIWVQVWCHLPVWTTHGTNTLILLLLGLPLVDLFVRPPSRLHTNLAPEKRYYSYEVARRDPAGFARWWRLFGEEFAAMGRQLYIKDPTHRTPFCLRPGGTARLFDSQIVINQQGFRGPEIAQPKPNVYRIVCVGESTTFGCTLAPGEKPWPELLQAKINTRLKPARPVEVINAGVPSFTLQNNLARLDRDVLPLKPDLLICYHGYNGFSLLDESLPSTAVSAPPAYIDRPLRLLAMAEYRARVLLFRRHLAARLETRPPVISNVLETAYGRAYEDLAEIAQTNKLRLAIATHAMAVNEQSDPDVIEFYRAGFPAVYRLITANRIHSDLVHQIAALHPGVGLIRADKNLDGRHEKFIDLVHLTQEGREQLADNIFEAIQDELKAGL